MSPGFFLASAMNSCTFFTPSAGCTISSMGDLPIDPSCLKSDCWYGRLLYSKGFRIMPLVPANPSV
ncbi:hypothetical protein D3C72_1718150 [compost metagenome]